jgi:hypothetical protein
MVLMKYDPTIIVAIVTATSVGAANLVSRVRGSERTSGPDVGESL